MIPEWHYDVTIRHSNGFKPKGYIIFHFFDNHCNSHNGNTSKAHQFANKLPFKYFSELRGFRRPECISARYDARHSHRPVMQGGVRPFLDITEVAGVNEDT